MKKEQTINKLLEYIDLSKDWVLDQAPELFRQIIRYVILESIFGIVASFIVVFVCVWICKKFSKIINDSSIHDDVGIFFMGTIISVLFILFFGINFFVDMSHLLKATLAPKLYLLDYLKK